MQKSGSPRGSFCLYKHVWIEIVNQKNSFSRFFSMATRKSYTILFKLKVLKYAADHTTYAAAKVYQVTEKMIRYWRTLKPRYVQADKKNSRCKLKYRISNTNHRATLDELLMNWINRLRERDMTISGSDIQHKAREFHAQTENPTLFTASSGWLEKFLSRHGLTRRRVSSTGRDLPSNSPEILENWFGTIAHARAKNPSSVFNMDETSLYLDSPCKFSFRTKVFAT